MSPPRITRVLETSLYAQDLRGADHFYGSVLGLERIAYVEGRHIFFRCGEGVLLIFDPRTTATVPTMVAASPIPLHGATGPGHMALAVPDDELPAWSAHLEANGVVIDSEVIWPGGGRSLYVRDPEGNSVELASPRIWGFQE